MRPVIVETLNNHFNAEIFSVLIPNSLVIYIFALVICLIIFVNRSSKNQLVKSHAFWSAIWAVVFGLIGSKIYFLLQNIDAVVEKPSLVFAGGTGSWGGYIGGTLGFLLSLKLYRMRIIKYLDTAFSTLGLGIFIFRWNCFLYGCCYGTPSSLPWAVKFPKGSYAYNAHLLKGYINPDAQTSLAIHPLQIYYSLNGLLLFILASWYWKRLRHRPGVTFCLFWLSYCITRFGLEFFRNDGTRGFMWSMSVPQVICILFIPPLIFGVWWFIKLRDNE